MALPQAVRRFFFQAEDGIRDGRVTGVQTCALPIFHIGGKIVTFETGSGDRYYDWIELAWIAPLAILATIIWSILDRKRQNYSRMHSWFQIGRASCRERV